MLEGGGQTQIPEWSPDLIETMERVAENLTVEEQNVMGDSTPVEDLQYGALLGLWQFANSNPGAWLMLRRYIAEQSRQRADRCAAINPNEDPMKRHGIQCFHAGGANALIEVSRALDPGVLATRLRRLRQAKQQQAVLAIEQGLDN